MEDCFIGKELETKCH